MEQNNYVFSNSNYFFSSLIFYKGSCGFIFLVKNKKQQLPLYKIKLYILKLNYFYELNYCMLHFSNQS